ncbi:MAG TPA: BON domain-containing protein [Polyangiaceae bacterium]|nr:BON domain-containing protein [Polyangiaceae bacterium]
MNEQDRYRGTGSQRGQFEGNEWQRSSDQRNRGQANDESRTEYRGNEYPSSANYGQSSDRNQSDQRNFGRDERSSQDSWGAADRPFREQDRDYRGGSSGFGQQRDYQHESSRGLGGGSYPSGLAGGLGGGRSSTLRGGFGVGRSWDPSESAGGNRSDYFRENRGDYGASHNYGASSSRGQAGSSLTDFGDRTRSEAQYYSNRREGQIPFGGQSHFGRGPKGYARSDERIREDVCERLSENDEVDASDVEVTVRDREVTLTGTTETRRMKHIAEDIADSVSGVQDVHNNITVRKPLLKEIADKITGDDEPGHHAHGGTKTSGISTTSASSNTNANSRV